MDDAAELTKLTEDSSNAAAIAATALEGAAAASASRKARFERRRARWREYIVVDLAAIATVCGIAAIVTNATSQAAFATLAVYTLGVIVLWFSLNALYGAYTAIDRRPDSSAVLGASTIFHAAGVAAWAVYVAVVAVGAHLSLAAPVSIWLLSVPVLSMTRSAVRATWSRVPDRAQRTVIVGAGEVGRLLAHKIQAHPESGLKLVGFVDAQPRSAELAPLRELVPVLGDPSSLAELVESYRIDRVVIAFSIDRHERLLDVIRELAGMGVDVDLVPRLFEVVGSDVEIGSIEGLPLLSVPTLHMSPASQFVKRTFDLLVAGLLLLVLLPSFIVIAIAIKLDSEGPVFFRQRRIGTNGPFTILKFRSMTTDADRQKSRFAHLNFYASNHGDDRMFKIQYDPRVTRTGALIRRYFLDELPQLFNVLRGEMSLVGPRPLIPEEDKYVLDWQRRRLALKPGMTGLWQVLGSNEIPFDEMVKLDYLYVSGWSLKKDIQLLLQTVTAVCRRRFHY